MSLPQVEPDHRVDAAVEQGAERAELKAVALVPESSGWRGCAGTASSGRLQRLEHEPASSCPAWLSTFDEVDGLLGGSLDKFATPP